MPSRRSAAASSPSVSAVWMSSSVEPEEVEDHRARRPLRGQRDDALLDGVRVRVQERPVAADDPARRPAPASRGGGRRGPTRRSPGRARAPPTGGQLIRMTTIDKRRARRPRSVPAARPARARPPVRSPRTRSRCADAREHAAARRSRRSRRRPRSRSPPAPPVGGLSNSGARNAPVSRINPAASSDASWLRPPAPSAAAVWLAPPDWTNPDDSPASAFAAPIAHEVAVGIDPVAVADREPACHADRLGAEDEHAERRRHGGRRGRRPRRLGSPDRAAQSGSRRRRRPHAPARSSSADTAIASTSTSSVDGTFGDQPAARDQHHERAGADGERRRVHVAQLAEQVPQCREEAAVGRRDAQQARELGERDHHPRTRTGTRSSPASTRGRRPRRSAAGRRAPAPRRRPAQAPPTAP